MLLLSLASACGEKDISLGSGYRYVELDPAHFAIAGPDYREVVEPDVTRCVAFDRYVVGEQLTAGISRSAPYFILDLRNGHLANALNKIEFENALKGLGLSAVTIDRIQSSLFHSWTLPSLRGCTRV